MFIRSSKVKTAVMANVHLEHERSWKNQKLSVRNHYGHFYSFFSAVYEIIYNYKVASLYWVVVVVVKVGKQGYYKYFINNESYN